MCFIASIYIATERTFIMFTNNNIYMFINKYMITDMYLIFIHIYSIAL